ncbi:MAG: transketolase [Gammaproteobacteria bacterium]
MPTRKELANAIRVLSMDAVQQANSGHPGMPMGMADIAEVLWNDFLKHNPNHFSWLNRDRFVVSNGHGSMLLYSLLHLTGYPDMTMDQIKHFRQLHSITPGHPEYGVASGVETTTGPLGQGIANAVGMAIAERTLAAEFNQPGFNIIDHYTYVFMGDGCLMEGISHEACSLAGTLGLGKLIAFWDDNGISIDGEVEAWFSEDTAKRFEAYGWHVLRIDGHDANAIKQAIIEAQQHIEQPSLICCKTIIAYGSPNLSGKSKSHGAPLGAAEVALVREQLNWNYPSFVIPEEIYKAYDAREKGQILEKDWNNLFEKYGANYPELAKELLRRVNEQLPANWSSKNQTYLSEVQNKMESIATRKASQLWLNALSSDLPEFFGGSADLSESNLTFSTSSKQITKHVTQGNYLFYGVREFGMAAIMNGIALHGGFIPYGGTFLTFVDYMRNAIRLSALMKQRVIYVLTHDSIGLGEDGPTHQPIEHISMLRLTPNVSVWRPCDIVETSVAWEHAVENHIQPTCLLLSRQNLPANKHDNVENVKRGGYILYEGGKNISAIIIATGSEVQLALAAAQSLAEQGQAVRVVSMPSTNVFEQQTKAYQESVLPSHIAKRVAVEAGATAYWYKYVGLEGSVVGLDRYGESAPAKDVFKALGITTEHVIEAVLQVLNKKKVSNVVASV